MGDSHYWGCLPLWGTPHTSLCFVVAFTALLDRRVGSKTHTVSLTLHLSPTQELSSHGKPNVYLDLSNQRHETALPGGFHRAKLVEAVKEGVEGGCLQGKGFRAFHP